MLFREILVESYLLLGKLYFLKHVLSKEIHFHRVFFKLTVVYSCAVFFADERIQGHHSK
jgi:hypothetical protein